MMLRYDRKIIEAEFISKSFGKENRKKLKNKEDNSRRRTNVARHGECFAIFRRKGRGKCSD